MLEKVRRLNNNSLWIQTEGLHVASFSNNVMCTHCRVMCLEYSDNVVIRMTYPVGDLDSFIKAIKEDSLGIQIRRHDIN